jgi:hypothetical protein
VERPSIKALDTGAGGWFHVDVVLRPTAPSDDDGRLAAAVSGALDTVAGPERGRDPVHEYSYDVAPPEGELGVGLWVRAVGIGAAVDAAIELVLRCAADLGHAGASLWDVRALPEEAVLSPRGDWP